MGNCTMLGVNPSMSGAQRKGMVEPCCSHLNTESYLPEKEELKFNNSFCCVSTPRSYYSTQFEFMYFSIF